jgi:2-aminoadipate transaminase
MKDQGRLASRTVAMGASAIREILKVTAQPGMVSLAGGLPASESFPVDIIENLCKEALGQWGPAALQYSPTEGFGPLREALVDLLAARGVIADTNDITVASGSQGVLDALGMVLISKGDAVAVEAPTYLGALQAFNPYEPEYVRIATDAGGLIPEALENVLKRTRLKFIYLVPTFQNPTGRTLSLERRKAIARLIQDYDALLVEDDPYRDLRYQGEPLAPIKSLAPDHVIYIGTLSKIFAPGLRIGFCVAPQMVKSWMVVAKQGIDLHTSTFNQALAARYLTGDHLTGHLPRIIELYRPRQQAMLTALSEHFPSTYTWSQPEGGMFVWVSGPPGLDMEAAYRQAVKRKVAFVPGKFFFTDPKEGLETMRLNFTSADPIALERAVATLGEVLSTLSH